MILASPGTRMKKGALKTCREIEARGQRAEAIHLDLSQLPDGAKAIETLISRFGRIDVLVNNAGAMTKAAFLDMEYEQWRSHF
ncbi:Cyclopentanol dehydrogenase [Leclercia adecarboxylata]|uniref:Cyclopentanol dehydrogenase n=1 Tax=Leclercia adecarboxylata TaxID=83655 RepID=A0A4U9I3X8_9ENTR|nr:Cyclopentanol dehydrogenase [Leclercia adecarboxylata]